MWRKRTSSIQPGSLWLSLLIAINIPVIYLKFLSVVSTACVFVVVVIAYSRLFTRPFMFECRESLSPEPSLRVTRFVEKQANCDYWPLSDRQQTPFIHVCQRQHSQYSKPPLLYNSVTVETTCFTGHSITLSHPFFPFFVRTRGLIKDYIDLCYYFIL